jgi:RND family efflux transporter MFP subunit
MRNLSFTCSFYPTVIALACFTVACGGGPKQAATPPVLPVRLQTIEPSAVTDSSDFVGNLVAHEFVQLAPKIEGRILRIYVNYGQRVRKNDPIILLEPTQQQEQVNAALGNLNIQRASLERSDADLKVAEAQRDAAQAQVAAQQANVANAQANYANSVEVLKTREADLKRAQATLNLAGINFKRSKFLVETGVQPQQDLDNKTTDLKDSEANTEASLKTVQAAKASVNANVASVKAAQAALKQAQDNLRAAQQQVSAAQADIKRQQAAIKQASGQLGVDTQQLIYNRVLAPIDGIVGNIPYKVGDVIKTGQEFTTITNNSLMEMDINVPIERMNQLRKGLTAEIIKEDGSVDAVGGVEFISPTADQDAQSVLAKVIFRNNGRLVNNQYVRVRLIWDRTDGVLVPTSAITVVGAQKFVFVAEKGKTPSGQTDLVAKQKPVKVGGIQGQSYQVLSGLETGERVAVSRILELRNGIAIKEETLAQSEPVSQ